MWIDLEGGDVVQVATEISVQIDDPDIPFVLLDQVTAHLCGPEWRLAPTVQTVMAKTAVQQRTNLVRIGSR